MLNTVINNAKQLSKQIAMQIAKKTGIIPPPQYPPDFTQEDIADIIAAKPYTMTSPERIVALRKAVEYITRADLPGDIVECGVWKGGSMMVAARTLVKLNSTRRKLYLFDTYEGMTPPQDVDRSFRGESASEMLKTANKDTAWVWAYAPIDGVKQVMASTNYPGEIEYVKGPVEETLPGKAPEKIALLRLDTDWYQSTYHELVHLYPRLVPGGVLIIDDYGHWEGARRAVDQYFAENKPHVLLHRIDNTGRMLVKPA